MEQQMIEQAIYDNHGLIILAPPGSHVTVIVLDKKNR